MSVLVLASNRLSAELRRSLLNEVNVELVATQLKRALGYGRYDLGLSCVCAEEMAAYNHQYRGINGPTDVLSFPYTEPVSPGVLPEPSVPCDFNLGDIIVCPEIIATQAAQDGAAFARRLPIIIAHSLCHLTGHDHETTESESVMRAAEYDVLRAFAAIHGDPVPYHPLGRGG